MKTQHARHPCAAQPPPWSARDPRPSIPVSGAGGGTASCLAEALGLEEGRGFRDWLDLLVALGVVHREGGCRVSTQRAGSPEACQACASGLCPTHLPVACAPPTWPHNPTPLLSHTRARCRPGGCVPQHTCHAPPPGQGGDRVPGRPADGQPRPVLGRWHCWLPLLHRGPRARDTAAARSRA